MSKTLFTDRWKFTYDGIVLLTAVSDTLHPIMVQYLAMGYSPREISYIMARAIVELELDAIAGEE